MPEGRSGKKLEGAARRLNGQDRPAARFDHQVATAARAMGMPEALIAENLAADASRDDAYQVWPENWRPVLLAAGMQGQWRLGPTGKAYAYDFAALPAVEARIGLPVPDDPQQAAEDFQALLHLQRLILS